MFENEFTHLINGVNAVQVALTLRRTPGKQAMAAKDEAFGSGIVLNCAFNQKRQLKSRALPGYPYNLAIKFFVELFQFAFPIRTRSQSNRPVRMQMIHMSKREECVQRSINGCGNAVFTESREWIVADHFIFVLLAAVELFELFETIQVEQSKSSFGDGPDVSAAALHCQYSGRPASERIGQFDLGTCVSAAEIGDAQIH